MARIEEIERRLQNWARWKAGMRSGGMSYARIDLEAAQGGRDGYREATIPTSDCEADETERAVAALDGPLRAAVEVVYLMQHKSARWHAARLCVSEPTVKDRIWKAHRAISHWLTDRQQQARQERERIEQLGRAALPRGVGRG